MSLSAMAGGAAAALRRQQQDTVSLQDLLLQREMQRQQLLMQQARDAEHRRQFDTRTGQDQSQFDARMGQDREQFTAQQNRLLGRDKAADEQTGRENRIQDDELSREANARGLLQRGMTGVTLGTMKPIQAYQMAQSEGADVSLERFDPEIENRARMAEIAARNAGDLAAIRERNAGDLAMVNARVAPQPAGSDPASTYADERRARMLSQVEDVLKDIGPSSAGPAAMFAWIGGTPPANLRAKLDSLAANVAFSELQEMRNASKTGGALGQVAVRELELLQSARGSLSQTQSPAQLKSEINKIKDSLTRWEMAKTGGADIERSGAGGGRAQWKRGPDGKPVRVQ